MSANKHTDQLVLWVALHLVCEASTSSNFSSLSLITPNPFCNLLTSCSLPLAFCAIINVTSIYARLHVDYVTWARVYARKIPAVGAGTGAEALLAKRGGCGREEEDGRGEGTVSSLESRTFLLVVNKTIDKYSKSWTGSSVLTRTETNHFPG